MSRVALIGENSVEYVNVLLDIWNNGDCAVLLDWRIPFKTAVKMMVEAGVTRCCIENGRFDNKKDIFPESIEPEVFERQSNSAELLPQYIYDKYRDNYSDNEAVVIYSSGTTGTAKGIILSHYAIQTNADAIIDYMKPVSNDCIYICKTISHSSTLVGELLVALKFKMRLIMAPIIVPPRYVLSNIEKFGVTILCVNPTLLSMYADEYNQRRFNLSSLRTIYVSGSILNNKIYEKAHTVFSSIPIYNVYGLSELGPRVSAQTVNCCKSNSVGKPIKDVEIRIVNEQGIVVPNGERGILHVYTPCKFDGYIIGTQKYISLYEKWQNTGDIAYIDEFNELHILNRVDDVIIIDSHKIYPSDIEEILINQTSIKDCAVVKIDFDSHEFLGCLYVGEKENDFEIKAILKKKLMTYEIPRYFVWCDNLPKNKNGKIITGKVKDYLKKYICQEKGFRSKY